MKKGKVRATGRMLAIALAVALMVTAVAAGGKWGKVIPSGSEKCWVTPDPTLNGQESFTVNGSGFKPSQPLAILVGVGTWLMATGDYTGSFSASTWAAFRQTGAQTVKVYQSGDRKMTVLASCSFQVQ
jgi:hypothetical protein